MGSFVDNNILGAPVVDRGGEITEDDLIALKEKVMEPPKADVRLETGGVLYAFTAEEIMDLRRTLLPNRMSRHDLPGETKLRQHVENIQKRRGKKPSHD